MPEFKHVADPIDIHVGARLKMLRNIRGMSQEKLAENLGITFQQVQKYETGANRVSASRLWGVCTTFGVMPNFFFEGLDSTDSKFDAAVLSNEELRTIDNLRRLSQPISEALMLTIEAVARPDRVVKKTDGSIMSGANKELSALVRPFGRLPNKQNYLTAEEATKLYEYFRDVVWRGQYDFNGSPWQQTADGGWRRINSSHVLIVQPDGCAVIEKGAAESCSKVA